MMNKQSVCQLTGSCDPRSVHTQVNHSLREVVHTCSDCGKITVSTLGLVETKTPADLWLSTVGAKEKAHG